MSKGLLFVWMEIPERYEEEFHAWYDTEHVPEREAVPGFIFVRRFASVDGRGPRYLATYLLADPAVLQSPAYQAISYGNVSPWTRRIMARATCLQRMVYEETGPRLGGTPATVRDVDQNGYSGTGLLVECAHISPDREAGFHDWYERERLLGLLAIPGVRAARRFRLHDPRPDTRPDPPRYVTLYELDDVSVLSVEALRPGAGTQGSAAGAMPWPGALRTMGYRQIYPPLCNETLQGRGEP